MCNPFLASAFGLVQDLKVSSVKLGISTVALNSNHNIQEGVAIWEWMDELPVPCHSAEDFPKEGQIFFFLLSLGIKQ